MKPKIAILSAFPVDHTSFTGGVETATAALIEGLRDYADEFDFHLFSPSTAITRDIHERRDGITFHFLGGLHRPWLRPRLPLRMAMARGQLHRLRPDLVHCQDNPDLVMAAVLEGHRPVLTIHGVASDEAHLRTGWEFWSAQVSLLLGKLAVRHVRAFICNSAYVARLLQHGVRAFAIPNAVSSTFLSAPPPTPATAAPYLVFVGVLAPLKRPADLLAAHETLRAEFPTLRTIFCGGTEDAGYVEGMHRDVALRGTEGVEFAGRLSHDRVAALLHGAAALVLPSAQENAPMAIAEAMAIGIPVVATRVGGVPEMVEHGKSGLLYEPGDVAGLSVCLRQLLGDAELRARMGRRGRELATACYAPAAVARATVGVYRGLLKEMGDTQRRRQVSRV